MLISEASLVRSGVFTPCPVWEYNPFAASRRFERAKAGADPARMGRRLNWAKGRVEGSGRLKGPTQNPTLPLRTYQSYTNTHTDSKCEHAPLFRYVLLFLHIHLAHNFRYFFLLYGWLHQTPIKF
jgi:hypothetical protein